MIEDCSRRGDDVVGQFIVEQAVEHMRVNGNHDTPAANDRRAPGSKAGTDATCPGFLRQMRVENIDFMRVATSPNQTHVAPEGAESESASELEV